MSGKGIVTTQSSPGVAYWLADALEAGIVGINRYHLYNPATAFGGYSASGIGRELGIKAFDLYTQSKRMRVAYRDIASATSIT